MEMRGLIPFCAQVASSVRRLTSYARVKDMTEITTKAAPMKQQKGMFTVH